jgi:hypothetical protein
MSTLLGCTVVGSKSTVTPISPLSVSEDEYAVYHALLEARYIVNDIQLIVISDHTGGETLNLEERMGYIIQNFPDLTAEMISDFLVKNQQPTALEPLFDLGIPTVLLSDDEFQQIFMDQNGWQKFYDLYPGSQGVMTLSRVGFNAKRDMALVYVGNQSFWLAGAGYYLLLVKENNIWNIVDEEMAWIS